MLTWFYGQQEEKEPDDQMVHRPSDSRLLSNLITHEKNYSKELQNLLDSSHASLASLSAYAAATGQPVSRVITSIAGDFSSADDALRRYKDAVDAWGEQLKTLKDMETEVSTIIRDREILVTRLLKASKNEKPPKDRGNNLSSRRSSILGQRAPSSSSLSLSLDHSYALNTALPTSDKLAAAQAELQACEVHLAEKERELEVARVTALRDGLRIRCNALVECGMSWAEAGKDALHATESLLVESRDTIGSQLFREPLIAPQESSTIPHKALPLHMRPETGSDRGYHLSSDLSSIGPSQSASQVNIIIDQSSTANPSIIPNAPHPILGANGSDILPRSQSSAVATNTITRPNSTPPLPPPIRSSSPFALPIHRSNSMTHIAQVKQPVGYDTSEIQVPPAHAIRDGTMPTVASTTPLKSGPRRTGSGYITPVSNDEGSRSTLEGYRATRVGENLNAEGDDGGPGFSQERRLIKEGKLRVVENSRFHQTLTVSESLDADAASTNERIGVPGPAPVPLNAPVSVVGANEDVAGVREIGQESELPAPPTEPPPGVPSSVPAGEPRTPKKQTKRMGSPSPQKSGFLGSLKKVFGGGHRESSLTPQEKTREKEMKDREKKEKAREREVRREERLREQEEKREEQQRERQEKAKVKKRQKLAREHGREMRLLAPSSSDEDETIVDDDSLRRYRKEARTSKLAGVGKNVDKERIFHDASEIRGESVDPGEPSWTADGYVMKKNMDLERNLKGGVLEARREHDQGRERVRRRAGGSMDVDVNDGIPFSQGGTFIVERGAKVTRSSSVPHRSSYAPPSRISGERSTTFDPTVGNSMVLSGPRAPHLTDTRFREELNSQNGSPRFRTPSGVAGVATRDNGYASETPAFTPSARIGGIPATSAAASLATSSIVVPTVTRKSSKKRSSMAPAVSGEGTNVSSYASALNTATAPAGMSTGLGGRRGSVGVSVATPHTAVVGGSHRRVASVNYGQPRRASAPPVSQGPRESLMSIVDNVTRSNRQAWDTGLMESRMVRVRGTTRAEAGNPFLGPVPSGGGVHVEEHVGTTAGVGRGSRGSVYDGSGSDFNAGRTGLDGVSHSGNGVVDDVLEAPPRVNRQSLMTSPKGTPGSPGRAQPITVYTTRVDGAPEKRPLKSALRVSRSPSPDGTAIVRGHATRTGKDRLVPMTALPSVSSSSVEDPSGPPPPVERAQGVDRNDVEYGRNYDESDDGEDSASTSSYETGLEDFDDSVEDSRPKRRKSSGLNAGNSASHSKPIDRRPGLGSPPLVVPSPVRSHPMTLPMASVPPPADTHTRPGSFTPTSTPSRRKSVRVSLNPTFSPTPPAIEDEEDETDRAPFIFKEVTPVPSVNYQAPSPVKQVPKEYGTKKSEGKTIWDDDSDDDAEYQRAKVLLLKATRKEKEVFSNSGGSRY